MSRSYIVSPRVLNKLSDLVTYLKDDCKVSEEAALAYHNRFLTFIRSFGAEVDYPLCRFKRWRALGYRCAVFEKNWILAYEKVEEGVIVRDISHTALLSE